MCTPSLVQVLSVCMSVNTEQRARWLLNVTYVKFTHLMKQFHSSVANCAYDEIGPRIQLTLGAEFFPLEGICGSLSLTCSLYRFQ